jgi:hypothetical protein
MPETDTIPVSASVASTGKDIRYSGSGYWYGFSGELSTTAGNYTEGFNFSSPNQVLKAHVELYVHDPLVGQNDAWGFRIKLNDLIVARCTMDDRATPRSRQLTNNINFIIPPLTEVIIELITDSDETNFGAFMLSASEK